MRWGYIYWYSIIYFTLCKIKKKFVSKTYIKVHVTFDAEVMVAPLAMADVNPSIESWKLHLSLLQKHSSTLGAALWLLPLLTRTDSNSTRQPSANGKKEGAHPRNMPTKNGEKKYQMSFSVCIFGSRACLIRCSSKPTRHNGLKSCLNEDSHLQGCRPWGCRGCQWHRQILVDQLTLSQPGGQIMTT